MNNTPNIIAQFLFEFLRSQGSVHQAAACSIIVSKFGNDYIHPTQYGGFSIDSKIRTRLRKLVRQAGDTIEWDNRGKYWTYIKGEQ